MNIVGFTNLVVLALAIVVVYPLLKIQFSRVVGRGRVSTLLAVVLSIALLKLATYTVEKIFVDYGVDFEAKERKPTREEMKHRESMHHEGMYHEGMHHEGMYHEGMHHEGMYHEGMHHEGMYHEGMKGGKTKVNMVGTDEYKNLSGGRSAEQEQRALSNNQVLSMMKTNETMNEMTGEGFGMRREGFGYGGSKEGLFHMGGKKEKKSNCDCGCK